MEQNMFKFDIIAYKLNSTKELAEEAADELMEFMYDKNYYESITISIAISDNTPENDKIIGDFIKEAELLKKACANQTINDDAGEL